MQHIIGGNRFVNEQTSTKTNRTAFRDFDSVVYIKISSALGGYTAWYKYAPHTSTFFCMPKKMVKFFKTLFRLIVLTKNDNFICNYLDPFVCVTILIPMDSCEVL